MTKLARRAAAAGAGAAAAMASWSSAAGAQEAPKVDLPSVRAGKEGVGGTELPGAGLLETIVSWIWWGSMLAILAALLGAGGMYAWYGWRKKGGDTNTAVTVFLYSLVGALVVGGGGLLANALFGIGYNTFN